MARYTIVKGREGFLGRGQFGIVEKVMDSSSGEVSKFALGQRILRRAYDPPTQVFACKTIRFPDSERHREPAEREYSILSRLDHLNVVKYVDIIWDWTSAKIYMNLCEGGSLADLINSKRLSRYVGKSARKHDNAKSCHC
jgi:serine/threonine protein kinase